MARNRLIEWVGSVVGFVFQPRGVGSNAYYQKYEKSLEKLSKEASRLRVKKSKRKRASSNVKTYATAIGVVLTAAVAAFANVTARAQGEHEDFDWGRQLQLVLLVVAIPSMVYGFVWVHGHWFLVRERWDDRRLKRVLDKTRALINELKDSTRFDRTHELLQKYDPSYAPPRRPMRSSPSMQGLKAAGVVPAAAKGQPGAISSFIDGLANRVGGTDPVLMQGLKEARQEVENMRQWLAMEQWKCAGLYRENQELRRQLGMPLDEQWVAAMEQQLSLGALEHQPSGEPPLDGDAAAGLIKAGMVAPALLQPEAADLTLTDGTQVAGQAAQGEAAEARQAASTPGKEPGQQQGNEPPPSAASPR